MNKIKEFILECKSELDKVVWPNKDECLGSTNVVIVFVILLTIFVYSVDWVYLFLVNKLFK